VVEHGLGHLPFTEKQVVTPTGMSLASFLHTPSFIVLLDPIDNYLA
jgi:hypothetical protein